MILAGDIGGTKCNLALVEPQGSSLQIVFLEHYPSSEYPDFTKLIDAFLRDSAPTLAKAKPDKILTAGFGVAGPVVEGRVHLTNLGWSIEAAAICRQINTPHVALLNDLAATGYSLEKLPADAFLLLNPGKPEPQATRAIIAAGTGLGESVLRWNGSRYVAEPSEGGHCDLAPRTEQEIELLRHMKAAAKAAAEGSATATVAAGKVSSSTARAAPRRSDAGAEPVSCEMVLSGRGFQVIHRFLDPAVKHPRLDDPEESGPEITRLAIERSCPVCIATLDLWTALYGAEAGNLALKVLARGGVVVAGGIAPKILSKLRDGAFVRAFCEKEKFYEFLAEIPIQVLLNEEAPLIGAAAEAARLLDGAA